MAWWDSVASLTPVAAWDALHFANGQLQDQVGSNAITVQGGVATPFPLYGLYGQDKPWPLATPMSLSGDFVLAGFVMHVSRGLVFYKTLGDSNSYFLDQESNGAIYQYANGSGGQVGSGPAWGAPKFMALVVSPASARVYINDDWAGAAFARSWVADSVGGIGYYADGNEYNIGGSERFFAAGLWSGVASLADVRALESACRAALAALLGQRGRESQRLADVALFKRLLRLGELAIEGRILCLGFALRRGVAALAGSAVQVLRGCLVIAVALGDITQPGEGIGVVWIAV